MKINTSLALIPILFLAMAPSAISSGGGYNASATCTGSSSSGGWTCEVQTQGLKGVSVWTNSNPAYIAGGGHCGIVTASSIPEEIGSVCGDPTDGGAPPAE